MAVNISVSDIAYNTYVGVYIRPNAVRVRVNATLAILAIV